MKRPWAFLVLALALVGSSAIAGGTPARAASPVLTVAPSSLPSSGSVTVTVTGRDYLVPPHEEGTDVFGGVYLFFGWVAEGKKWGPSARNSSNNDGTFGETYAYPGDGGDPSTRGEAGGTMRFISFTSGGESGETTEYHMDDDGNWTAPLVIRGPVFRTTPQGAEPKTYDCRKLRCGVFTIGAHGKSSATNERFTAVSFATSTPSPSPSPVAAAVPSIVAPTPTASPTRTGSPSPSPSPVRTAPPTETGARTSSSAVPGVLASIGALALAGVALVLRRR